MTPPALSDVQMGKFALALVMEDLRRRVEREETSEAEVAELVTAALDRFPDEFQSNLRTYAASHAAAA